MPVQSFSNYQRRDAIYEICAKLEAIAFHYANCPTEDTYVARHRNGSNKQRSRQLCIQRDVREVLRENLVRLGSSLPKFQQRRLADAICVSVAGSASLYDDTNLSPVEGTEDIVKRENRDRIIHARSWVWPNLLLVFFSQPEGPEDNRLEGL